MTTVEPVAPGEIHRVEALLAANGRPHRDRGLGMRQWYAPEAVGSDRGVETPYVLTAGAADVLPTRGHGGFVRAEVPRSSGRPSSSGRRVRRRRPAG